LHGEGTSLPRGRGAVQDAQLPATTYAGFDRQEAFSCGSKERTTVISSKEMPGKEGWHDLRGRLASLDRAYVSQRNVRILAYVFAALCGAGAAPTVYAATGIQVRPGLSLTRAHAETLTKSPVSTVLRLRSFSPYDLDPPARRERRKGRRDLKWLSDRPIP
jgi:hypothetical protein